MKKKIILALTACLFAAGSIIHSNLSENTSRMDVSLADISVMAQADGESGGSGNCGGAFAAYQWGSPRYMGKSLFQ